MVQRNLRPIGILLITFFALILCIVMTVAGFWLGRSSMTFTAEQDAVTVEEEVDSVQEDEAEQLIEEAEAEDSSLLPESPADEGDPGAPAEEPASPDEALEAEEFEVEPAEEGETEAPDLEAAETDEVEVEVEDDAAEVESIEERSTEFTPEDLEIIWQEVWPILAEQYDGELPEDDELRHRMIRGMLEALGDRFTRFTPPEAAALSRERLEGSFQGIGAFVRENEEGLVEIVRPIDQQPADRAGLLAGDMIIAVDGMSVTDMTLEEVLPLVRGPEGTEVTLTIRRPTLEEPFDVTIVRALIEIPLVESEMLEGDVAYIRLADFTRNAEDQLSETLEMMLAQNPQGLILDLRDNPGGFLDQSIAVADLFLDEGVVLYERSRTLGIDEVYSSRTGQLAEEIPLVVLVNAGSASAAEIVAGAVQDRERGVLIGETTFGKGSVQNLNTLSDGSELRVTIARWYTPDNVSIDQTGIIPDIEIETPADLGGEDDPQLERALEVLSTGE